LANAEGKTRWSGNGLVEQSIPMADVPAYARAATEQELALAAKKPGNHARVSHLEPPQPGPPAGSGTVRRSWSGRWLAAQRFSNVVEWLSYPYGLTG
jgi:hypothetical protein